MHLRHIGILFAAALSGVWWVLGALGNLQTASDALAKRGEAMEKIGELVSSPWSGAIATIGCLLLFGGLHAYEKYGPKAPRIKVEVGTGTARIGEQGAIHKPSADMIVINDGPPFSLVAHARLVAVAEGFPWQESDSWEYEARSLKGGRGKSWYHIATVHRETHDVVVALRGEHMILIRRWLVQGPLWFEVEWIFFSEVDSTLYQIGDPHTAVISLNDSADGFLVSFKTLGTTAASPADTTGAKRLVSGLLGEESKKNQRVSVRWTRENCSGVTFENLTAVRMQNVRVILTDLKPFSERIGQFIENDIREGLLPAELVGGGVEASPEKPINFPFVVTVLADRIEIHVHKPGGNKEITIRRTKKWRAYFSAQWEQLDPILFEADFSWTKETGPIAGSFSEVITL